MNANQKKRIEAIRNEAKSLRVELMKEWENEMRPRKLNELIADLNRTAQIMLKCNEIIERECRTDMKEQNTSTSTQEKSSEVKTPKN